MLCVSADLEAKANLLRKEALQCITIALAGSNTKKFWELLVAYFGANHKGTEEDDPWDFLDAAPAIPPPLPLTETESDDEKTSVKSAPVAPSTKVKAPRKPVVSQQKDLLDDLCGLKAAIRMYPADAGSLKETGIPPELQVKREHQTMYAGGSVYLCPHPKCQAPPFFAQSPSGIYSHIHQKHFGITLTCPYCSDKVYWNSKGWNSHMQSKHRNAPHFGTALKDEASLAQEMLRVMECCVAPPADAPKKCRVCKKPVHRPKEEAPTEDSSSSSDEGLVDSSSDSPSSSSDTTDTESTSATKPQKCSRQGESSKSTLTNQQLALMMYGVSATSAEPTMKSQPQSKILAR